MRYRHTPSPRQVTESNDAATLVLLAETLDKALDGLEHATARVAVMRALQNLNAGVRKLSP